MKGLIIIAGIIAFAFLIKVVDTFTSRKPINSVGAKSNKESASMPKVDISNPEELKKALEHYKGLAD